MSNKQQTAVEWYDKQLRKVFSNTTEASNFSHEELLQQAKEMEKEKRVDDYVNGMHKGQEIYFNHQIRLDVNSINYSTTIAENYYNETYGGNK